MVSPEAHQLFSEQSDVAIISRPHQPVDIEDLVQWAIARSGRLPWNRTPDRDLEMNLGLTARPRRRPPTNWSIAEACAGITLRGRSVPAMMTTVPDAQVVLAAITALDDPAAAATVLLCGRGRIRPDWMPGVVPKRVLKQIYGFRKNKKRRGRPIFETVWSPCSPKQVEAAREVYTSWHKALLVLAKQIAPGALADWTVTGLAAPATPWEDAPEKTA